MSINIIEPDKVQEWLESQPEGAIVGKACLSSDCPLARYVNQMNGTSRGAAQVSDHCWQEDYNMPSRNLDQWARDFVRLVDTFTVRGGEITREQALNILESCL